MNCVLAVWLRVRSFEAIEEGKVASMYISLFYFSMKLNHLLKSIFLFCSSPCTKAKLMC